MQCSCSMLVYTYAVMPYSPAIVGIIVGPWGSNLGSSLNLIVYNNCIYCCRQSSWALSLSLSLRHVGATGPCKCILFLKFETSPFLVESWAWVHGLNLRLDPKHVGVTQKGLKSQIWKIAQSWDEPKSGWCNRPQPPGLQVWAEGKQCVSEHGNT